MIDSSPQQTEKPIAGKPRSANAWAQILKMGERLLAIPWQSSQFSQGKGTDIVHNLKMLLEQRNIVVQTAESVLGGKARLWFAPPFRQQITLCCGCRDILPETIDQGAQELFSVQPLSQLVQSAWESRQLCLASDENQTSQSEEEAALAAPLISPEGSVLGVLQIERSQATPFTAEETDLAVGLATQSALAFQSTYQAIAERWRMEQLSLVRTVSSQLIDLRDLDELCQHVVHLIRQSFNYYYVAIFTYEPELRALHLRAHAGPHSDDHAVDERFSPDLLVHPGQGMIGWVAQSGKEILANDVSCEPRYRPSDALPETNAEYTLPLIIKDQVLGVLDVQSDRVGAFQETDLLILHTLADNIAVAIENTNLYKVLQRRAEHLSAIVEVSNAISSILDQETLLREVVDLIHKRFGYPYVHLFSVHPGRRKIFYEAGSGARSQTLDEQGLVYDLDDPVGLIPWVARHAETALSNDVELDPRYRPVHLPSEQTRSELVVPLIFGGEVLGVLDVQSDQRNAFGEQDRFLFEALASNIAVAMRNAILYRSEQWRRQVADSLREVAGMLSTEADLDQVLRAILTELQRTLPCDLAAIWLLDESAPGEPAADSLPPLRLAAVGGPDADRLDIEIGLELSELPSLVGVEGQSDEIAAITAWLIQALSSDGAVIRPTQAHLDPLGAALGYPADYSGVAAPLRAGNKVLGIMALVHHTSGRYGSESRAMTAAFASYAAVAIQNTRLYENAHEQAWVSTVLLQVAEATQSLTDLDELLSTVMHLTPTLSGVRACLVYILDEDGSFIPAAASGLDAEQEHEFRRWRFEPGQVPALDRLMDEKRPLILQDEAANEALFNIFYASMNLSDLFEMETLVLVPMLARGEILGAFLVEYSFEQVGKSDLEAWGESFEERLAIIQGIAHQTAIAVENIQLLRAQKEEAYVSVALLQVAQAVVSFNTLEEILGAIARITPILTGVKRSLIYLKSENNGGYRLAEAYGLPRSIQERRFASGEFPLLDLVCQENRFVAVPYVGEKSGEDILSTWARLEVPPAEEADRLIEGADRLLLAFPLSVQNSVLGVLLMEEPEPLQIESPLARNSNQRLRAKRLEIATGISQQTALAIQNAQLQQEMVVRERLEREMQLAHEIQRTFLPSRMLDLPGWDLKACWQTAREVGGDFYDFFELPGNRLGLVIADVADKGMPAALFMTLVRTLVRASVQDIDSPAEVLAHVNDVLVPDSQQGMFVTLVYAVVSLDSGQLVYANAGHNPPILVKAATRSLISLHPTGMALGIHEGIQIGERSVQLDPCDCLIFYTDGLTEAFSPQGEMYDDERLFQLVREKAFDSHCVESGEIGQTAQEILDAIEKSVEQFVQGAILSDDLTLMVLKRSRGESK